MDLCPLKRKGKAIERVNMLAKSKVVHLSKSVGHRLQLL